jgi:ABC-type uncharacterized transport system ATPase subunit
MEGKKRFRVEEAQEEIVLHKYHHHTVAVMADPNKEYQKTGVLFFQMEQPQLQVLTSPVHSLSNDFQAATCASLLRTTNVRSVSMRNLATIDSLQQIQHTPIKSSA